MPRLERGDPAVEQFVWQSWPLQNTTQSVSELLTVEPHPEV